MRIDLLSSPDDGARKRQRRTFRLEDLSGLRSIEVQLPLLPDSIAPWVSRVTIPPEASAEQRRGVLDLLRGHPGLRELVLKFGAGSDPNVELQALEHFPRLTALEIFAPAGLGSKTELNIEPVSELRQLRSLRVYGPIRNLGTLAALPDLRELEVLQDRDVIWMSLMAPSERVAPTAAVDAEPLRHLRRLRKLSLNCITDVSPLAALEGLEELTLDYSDVVDLAPLRSLRRLRVVSLDHTLVSELSPLSDLPELREVYVGCNGVTDVAPLAACPQLERLSLSRSQVPDLTPLQGCARLEQLDLSNGATPDLQHVAQLRQLRALSLANTTVDDISCLQMCDRLEVCLLDGTPLDASVDTDGSSLIWGRSAIRSGGPRAVAG